jgi:hypothetical protein
MTMSSDPRPYAREIAERCADSPHLPPTIADLTHIEAVIREVIATEQERCAATATVLACEAKCQHLECYGRREAARLIRALDLAGGTVGPREVDTLRDENAALRRELASVRRVADLCTGCDGRGLLGNPIDGDVRCEFCNGTGRQSPPQAAGLRPANERARAFVNGFWGMVEKVPGRRGERLVAMLADFIDADRATRPPAVPVDLVPILSDASGTFPDDQIGDRCNTCRRPATLCDADPIEEKFRCIGARIRSTQTARPGEGR